MLILGIETSCDETSAAVISHDGGGCGEILSNVVFSQTDKHALFGGVVPEIAARTHVIVLDKIIARALEEANVSLDSIDGIAATAGPGLIGSVVVGLVTAKAIALVTRKPLIAVNHLEGHVLAPRLTYDIAFPYLVLLISGGHTQFISAEGLGKYRRMGTTIDDAVGEAFDKTARLLNLPYPGGPLIEKHASLGDPTRFKFPKPLSRRDNFDLSFSGLKTAVRVAVNKKQPLHPQDVRDIAASFQAAVTETLEIKTRRALQAFSRQHNLAHPILVPTGGVASNSSVRASMLRSCEEVGGQLIVLPQELCTDNGAIIAWAGAERLSAGLTMHGMQTPARSRWPLDEV